jgi:hypothetical protein
MMWRRTAMARRRRHHDLLRRRGSRPGPDRRQMHRAGIEQERHRGGTEQNGDQRYRHPPGHHPELFAAFVGRHRPCPSPLAWISPRPTAGIQETRSDGNTGAGTTFALSGGIMPGKRATCGAPGRDPTLGA